MQKSLRMTLQNIAMTSILVAAGGCAHQPKKDATPLPPPTRLASIATVAPDATVIVLSDRSTWIIAPDSRAVAGQWQREDLVEAVSDRGGRASGPDNSEEFPALLTNQETGGSVHARQGADFNG